MTGPHRPEVAPAVTPRRRNPIPTSSPQPYLDAEFARGQGDAVLGALGRMQLRLDVLAREQSETFDRVLTSLENLERRLDGLERTSMLPPTPPSWTP